MVQNDPVDFYEPSLSRSRPVCLPQGKRDCKNCAQGANNNGRSLPFFLAPGKALFPL
jgi:hypothetical protein